MEKQRQIKKGELERHEFPSKWQPTKKQLQKESGGKCAYCEASTTESMHGDVEHYRPKSKYWWLAYVYDNYLASCQLCNQKFKVQNFEIASNGAILSEPEITEATTRDEMVAMAKAAIPDPLDEIALEAFEAIHRSERPLIPNPYIDDPSEVFAWNVREGIKEVELVPKAGNPDAPAYVDAAERLLGLNRPELKERRFETYQRYKLFADMLEDDNLSSNPDFKERAEKIIEGYTDFKSEYAGMIRFFESLRRSM
jgi:hypothetical protein